ncbi:MAG TPA: hypothetical protein VGK19_25285 [Capsulimonadaceae bacterium]|jgi:hypothetical protein
MTFIYYAGYNHSVLFNLYDTCAIVLSETTYGAAHSAITGELGAAMEPQDGGRL